MQAIFSVSRDATEPSAIHCDNNGPELISRQFVDWCEKNKVAIKYILPGKLNQNAFIERLLRSLKASTCTFFGFWKQGLEQVARGLSKALQRVAAPLGVHKRPDTHGCLFSKDGSRQKWTSS